MKKYLFTALIAISALTAISCEKAEERWADNKDAYIYLPQHGYTSNIVWDYEGGTFMSSLGVYASGLRPEYRKEEIKVGFTVDQTLIDAYNADETQQYAGMLEKLPDNCYTIIGTGVIIPEGENLAQIPVEFNTAAIRAAALDPAKLYVIPVKLTSTSKYELNPDEELNSALYGIVFQEPTFYFKANEYGTSLNSAKVYAKIKKGTTEMEGSFDGTYKIASYGVPDGEYTINIAYDPEAMKPAYKDSTILPQEVVTFDSQIVYKNNHDFPLLNVHIDASQLEFRKTYVLPLTMTSTSAYAPNADKSSLFLKVELKNIYEKTYASTMVVDAEMTSRSQAYAAKKSPVSYEADIVELQIATNNTIAGAAATAASSTTYNNKYMRLRIIEGDDIRHNKVEYILVTDKGTRNNSPATLEADPDAESYYDYMAEQFVLNYRWKHVAKKETTFVKVTEIIQAN